MSTVGSDVELSVMVFGFHKAVFDLLVPDGIQ